MSFSHLSGSSKISLDFLLATYVVDFLSPTDNSTRREFMLANQDLYIIPHNWTILHLLAILQEYNDFSEILAYPQFKTPFLLDTYGKTPLHYLFAYDKIDYVAINAM